MEEEVSFKSLFVPFTTSKAILFLIIFGLTIYSNGFFNSFLGDDLGQIVNNPYITSIRNIPSFFVGSTFYNGGGLIGNYFRPLPQVLFTLINFIFGQHAFFYHFVQLAIHIGNSIIIFLILKKFISKIPAFLASTFFLIHPINSEAVFYISNTQEVLFLFFGLLSFYFVQNISNSRYLIASGFLVFCSLISKETGVIFFALNIAYLYLFKRSKVKEYLLVILSFLACYLILRFNAIGFVRIPTNSPIASLTIFERLTNIPEIVLFYVKTFLFPISLASSYQWVYTKISIQNFIFPLIVMTILVSLTLFAFRFIEKSKKKMFIFFSLWVLIGLLPHLQIFPLDATVGERWFYFSSIGILGLIALIISSLKLKKLKKFLFVIILLIFMIFSAITFKRSFDFRNTYTLAIHDLRVSKAYGLYNILSYDAFQKGDYKKSKEYAQSSIELHPFMTNYLNLGASEFAMGEHENAYESFMTSIRYGDYYQTYENLALLSLSYGDPKKNIGFIKNVSLKKYPRSARLWFYLAALEYNYGDKNEALLEIQNAYGIDHSEQIKNTYYAILHGLPVNIGLNENK